MVVPNYNYAKKLKERLRSIEDQTHPIEELIILDDASTDESMEVINSFKKKTKLKVCIYCNKKNSGSVFSQWIKGFYKAQGDYIWIAEADDLSERNFLEEVMRGFDDPNVILSYSASKIIDWEGEILADPYRYSIEGIKPEKWKHAYINDGLHELKNVFVIRNNIHNASSAVMKKIDLAPIQNELKNFSIAGDWYLYTYLLNQGKIAYTPKTLNLWRRHGESQSSQKNANLTHYQELVKMQEMIFKRYGPIDPMIWIQSIQHRKDALGWLHIYQEGVEKFLFVVSTPQSGCERLMELIKLSAHNIEIKGRNEGVLFSLYESVSYATSTHLYHSRSSSKLWCGAEEIDPYRLRDRLCSAFVQELIRPKKSTKITGYCEVDLLYHPSAKLNNFIKFLLESFINSRIIFWSKNSSDITKSGWYKNYPKSELMPLLQKFEKWMKKMHFQYPKQTLYLNANENDDILLRKMQQFIELP